MQTRFVERHIRSLSIAKLCAELGARVRTICYLTGLEHNELVRLLFIDERSAPRGRPPDSPEWYHHANLIEKVEASIVVSIYLRVRDLGFGPAEALVGGFEQYRRLCSNTPRISFDRAFDLVCHTEGIWIADRPRLAVAACSLCRCRSVVAIGETPNESCTCPFCKLSRRYACDKRIQATFPARVLPPFATDRFGLLSRVCAADTSVTSR